jgi:hypothetical protein
MAIERSMAKLLMAESAKRPFRGSILQLGRQAISFNEHQLRNWSNHAGAALSFCAGNENVNPQAATESLKNPLSDGRFFRLLGFDEVASCDASAYEDSTLLLDLNHPVERSLHNRFDVVIDGGTMEHVFNVPAVLANAHAMLKTGGRVIHIVPASNMINHGFYSFSPTLFYDYYCSNYFNILNLSLFECVSWTGEWTVYDCLSGRLDNRLGRIASAKMAGVFCVAEKTATSTSDVIPTQSHFAELWKRSPVDRSPKLSAQFMRTIKANAPGLADWLYLARALIWRTSAVRRAGLPPLSGKY